MRKSDTAKTKVPCFVLRGCGESRDKGFSGKTSQKEAEGLGKVQAKAPLRPSPSPRLPVVYSLVV